MLLGNAIAGSRTIMASSSNHIVFEPDDIPFGSFEWFVFAGVSCLLVLFAGIMSGLTLGLMSLGLVDLEILQRSGTITEKKQAGGFALSKETTSDVLSNAQCALAPWVLDAVLGHSDALFRRAQLKALVSIHSQEAGKGGELTHDETTIISGALDLTEKTAEEAMTPIESTFSLDVNLKLDWESIGKILARGHSRIPVYAGNPKNIIGLLLVKSLLTVRPETETPVSAVSIRRMPRVPAHMPLYDILNEFQKGSSHMAAVVKVKGKTEDPQFFVDGQKFDEHKVTNGNSQLTTPLLTKYDSKPDSVVVDIAKPSRPTTFKITPVANGVTANSLQQFSEDTEDREVIGIITLEDVFEELLQEEIVDETDVYIDVHKRIRVVAAAAASSVARAPSNRRLIGQKPSGVQSKQGQMTRKPMDDESQIGRSLANPGERLPSSIERS
ncbi:hypothetical protein GOBAR_AA08847 [Gossypium barbadense]|uniref:CNNM transmembrane domain-containing protein n=1 Tax=Gossypium barbadense TaxID=3634 RepID=A0A2P5Y892_GOSBA|nr:hypothetical protein GOBAR_AA08847 [Gossypium barbadense]